MIKFMKDNHREIIFLGVLFFLLIGVAYLLARESTYEDPPDCVGTLCRF